MKIVTATTHSIMRGLDARVGIREILSYILLRIVRFLQPARAHCILCIFNPIFSL